ncbi:hypothetical protein EDD96_0692 [Streptomyces sp. Ag109_G2-6]|uniref:hypothetical protein n=1 Tax=Streptomyces TaxID=1883 RepID=UPI0009A4C5DB|nr:MULTISPECIES: hypothetical protein [Streptomyces]RPF44172.1 hypothetical protein EDD96_0692 [Streptomyces sp. Ag109_G2-6]
MTTPATAWPLENAVFSAAMLAHRLPWADAPARALGLDSLTREGAARGVLAHLRRSRSGRPVRLRTPFGPFLVPLGPAGTAGLLAAGAAADALAPAVRLDAAGRRHGLHPHVPLPPDAAPPAAAFAGPLAEELRRVAGARRDDHTLPWEVWRPGLLRAARRVVAGAAAAEDTLLSEVLLRTAAAAGSRAHDGRAAALRRRIAPYLADPEPGTVAAGLASAHAVVPGARTAGAVTSDAGRTEAVLAHTLAVVSEAAVGTALQALALAAAGVPDAAGGPAGAVALALDVFPPVEAAVHPVRSRFVWDGTAVEPGTEILAAPAWLRDAADTAPAGRDGVHAGEAGDCPDAAESGGTGGVRGRALGSEGPSPLCGSATGCTATAFAALVAEEIVRFFTATARPSLLSPALTADRIPLTLAPHTLLMAVPPAGTLPAAPAAGPGSYAVLARADADRLDALARGLADCAAEPGWSGDETGEAFRMRLLDHAERCTRAASDVRAAARFLAD